MVEAAIDDIYIYEAQANATSTNNTHIDKEIELLYITDVLGRMIDPEDINNYPILLYIYNDGSVQKKIIRLRIIKIF